MQLEIIIDLILHATENENKVLEELESVFHIEQKNFQIEQVPGHFNNPILLISSKLKKKICRRLCEYILFKNEKRRL